MPCFWKILIPYSRCSIILISCSLIDIDPIFKMIKKTSKRIFVFLFVSRLFQHVINARIPINRNRRCLNTTWLLNGYGFLILFNYRGVSKDKHNWFWQSWTHAKIRKPWTWWVFDFSQSEIEKLPVQNEAESFYRAFWATLLLKFKVKTSPRPPRPQIQNFQDFLGFSMGHRRFISLVNLWRWSVNKSQYSAAAPGPSPGPRPVISWITPSVKRFMAHR